MKYTIAILFMALSTTITYCQTQPFTDRTFSDEEIVIPTEFQNKNEVVLFHHIEQELITTEEGAILYELSHEKIKLNSDDAIKKNNKIYIGIDQEDAILTNKNRVILENGDIIELNKEDIHEEVDEENGRTYQYYAVRGLEKGAIIEKLYVKMKTPYLRGASYRFESSTPVVEMHFSLTYPNHLDFVYQSLNGLPEAIINPNEEEQTIELYVKDTLLDAVDFKEVYSNPQRHLKRFRFKLYENRKTGIKNFYNYKEFTDNFYSGFTSELSKKEQKALNKFLKSVPKEQEQKDQVLAIENYIKTQIVYNVSYQDNEDLNDILSSKQGNLRDLIRLYKQSMITLEIPMEIVITSNRYELYFPEDFETTDNLREILFYFPEMNVFLDPTNDAYRIPIFNNSYGNNVGLRIKETSFGGVIMPLGELMHIPIPGIEVTTDSMFIASDFSLDLANPLVKSKLVFGGYSGANFQAIKDYVPADRYQEILEDISNNYSIDGEKDKVSAYNDGFEAIGNSNFTMELEFKAAELTQRAGNKYLYKIGELIGRQTELYQESERKFPVEIDYPHNYYRQLTVNIPEGYKISNPEVLDMYFEVEMDGSKTALFHTTYNQNGQKLTITNKEYYTVVEYPLEVFPEYQQVINAAADFNKIVLIIEKE